MIIGLGNPGPRYAGTRHNVGFAVVDLVAEATDAALTRDRANALVGWTTLAGRRTGLVKPMTYMNRSGDAVRALLQQHDLTPGDLLVVYDDLHLPTGAVRLRPGGSAGGHNGVQSLIDRLGTDAFPRLRVGIGGDVPKGGQVDYVLSGFRDDEQDALTEALDEAVAAVRTFVADGIEAAMNRHNRRVRD